MNIPIVVYENVWDKLKKLGEGGYALMAFTPTIDGPSAMTVALLFEFTITKHRKNLFIPITIRKDKGHTVMFYGIPSRQC